MSAFSQSQYPKQSAVRLANGVGGGDFHIPLSPPNINPVK